MHLRVYMHKRVCVSYILYLAGLTLCLGILVLGGLVDSIILEMFNWRIMNDSSLNLH